MDILGDTKLKQFWAALFFTASWNIWTARSAWLFSGKRIAADDLAVDILYNVVWWSKMNLKGLVFSAADVLATGLRIARAMG